MASHRTLNSKLHYPFVEILQQIRASSTQFFCASSTPDARVFGSARATDSMQHFCDVRKFSQRCRLKLWSIARRHAENLKTNLRIFWRKNCAISAPNARFFSAQQRADPRWSYADGLQFAKRNQKRSLRAARRK